VEEPLLMLWVIYLTVIRLSPMALLLQTLGW
jgi:hypothetical protein